MLRASEIAFENNQRKYKWLFNQLDEIIVGATASGKKLFVKQVNKLKDDILSFMKKLPCFGK